MATNKYATAKTVYQTKAPKKSATTRSVHTKSSAFAKPGVSVKIVRKQTSSTK